MNGNVPIYVTRESSDGTTGMWSVSGWTLRCVFILIWLNLIAWGIVGLVTTAKVVL